MRKILICAAFLILLIFVSVFIIGFEEFILKW